MYMAFGPLGLTYNDLWSVTLADLNDMAEGWRYNRFLDARRDARLAMWIRVMVWAKKAPSVEDLTGVWEDGQVMSKEEQYRWIVRKIRNRRKRMP